MSAEPASAASIDRDEIARFDAVAGEWWNPKGKFRALHQINPVRIRFIRDHLCARFGREPLWPNPLADLRIVDIGCGGGLICEPLIRLGARVVGIDAAPESIRIAQAHAEDFGLAIDYRCTAAETLAAAGERFDAVLCLEVVEHVADVVGFLESAASLAAPGGLLIAATLNRTLKSFAFAVVGGEWVLRWLPRGTHDWQKFVRPHELARILRRSGLEPKEAVGVTYDPLHDRWNESRDLGVNYMMLALKR
jgi:2-polyprenyl-6-hydroxyphenyl methylase/3-demethylubiquinone-9 3-methyltransferase